MYLTAVWQVIIIILYGMCVTYMDTNGGDGGVATYYPMYQDVSAKKDFDPPYPSLPPHNLEL